MVDTVAQILYLYNIQGKTNSGDTEMEKKIATAFLVGFILGFATMAMIDEAKANAHVEVNRG